MDADENQLYPVRYRPVVLLRGVKRVSIGYLATLQTTKLS